MQNQHSRCGKAIGFALLAVAVLGSATAAWSQGPLPVLSTDQIVARLVQKNKERASGLQHYTAVRNYRLEYRGFPHAAVATMVVNVTFDAPGRKDFTVISSTGPKLLETRIFERLLESEQQAGDAMHRQSSEIGSDNYLFSLAGIEGTNYVLNVEPREDSKFLYRGKIWVDGHDFAVTRIEAQPARSPSMLTSKSLISHTYQKVDGGFYLPKENQTVTSVRLGGTATLTIDYGSYHVIPAVAKRLGSGESVVGPDSGLNLEMANFAGRK